ncbi:MAG: DUF348 domain-containing protein [Mogibacterium sp.]|nr:DUF348 domain-containing protein [Mogibacterium sp.]
MAKKKTTEKDKKEEFKLKRETIQLEREELRKKIAEIIEANYAKLEREAEKHAPDFNYEKEAEELKAEEEAELAAFEWADGTTTAEAVTEAPEVAAAKEHDEAAAEEIEAAASEEAEAVKDETAATAETVEVEKKETVVEAEAAEAAKEVTEEEKPLPPAKVSPSKYPKPKREYKSKLAKAVLGDRNSRVLAAALLMMAIFAGYQAWDYLVPKTVSLAYTTYDGMTKAEYATKARTAGEVLAELTDGAAPEGGDIRVGENDLMNTPEEMPIANGTKIDILKATKVKAKIAGKTSDLWLVPGTVEDNLKLNAVAFDEDDEIKPALDKKVSEKTKITVNEVHYKVKEKTEKVEAVDKVILDPSMTSGVQDVEEGNDGEGVFTYTTKYVNGKKKGTEKDVKEWITEPHDNVLRLGTSATGNSGEYVVTKTFTANTTAYTAGSGARGALGQSVHVGTCAVDPGFVSLRSELWVEGYGYAYANDTGGAVKGNVVDLYMGSRGQCISWGRRNVTAYVIVPEGD